MCFMSMKRLRKIPAVLMLLSGPSLSAIGAVDGGISLNQTRVVFLSTDKAQTLTVKNTGQQGYLIQSRVQHMSGSTLPVPFIVTPPLFTLQPDSRQLLRILPQGGTLPTDRESVFTLSVLAIPAQRTEGMTTAKVSMGMRFGLKLFYRPAGLKDNVEAIQCRLGFSGHSGGVLIENPTPYFQTFGKLTINGSVVNLEVQSSMLAPFSAQHYPASGRVTKVEWQTLTDYGGLSTPCQQVVSFTQEKP